MAKAGEKTIKEIPIPTVNQPDNLIFLLAREGVFALQRDDTKDTVKMLGTFDLAKCIEVIKSDKEVILPIFIKNLIHFEQNNNIYKLILEYNPFMYTMALNLRTGQATAKYEIYLPYMQFYLQIQDLGTHLKISNSRVSCTNKPLSSLEDTVYVPPLYNIYGNGTICYGSQAALTHSTSVFEHAKKFVDSFFSSEFSVDIGMKGPPEFPNIDAYVKLSKERPHDVLLAKFQPMGKAKDVWTRA